MQNAAWLVKFIQDEAKKSQSPAVCLAVVSSVEPFRIRLSNVELGSPFLSISSGLLADTLGEFPDVKAGDTVLVAMMDNKQQYVALTKVVNV